MDTAQVCPTGTEQVKHLPLPPVELTPEEMERLLRGFLQGKTEVTEDECLAVVKWAMEMRIGMAVLELVMEGELVPMVDAGEVKVAIPAHGGHTR